MISALRDTIDGLTLPFQALALIARKPRLLALSLLPIAITLLIYVYGLRVLLSQANEAVGQWIVAHSLDPSGWAAALILLASKVLLFVLAAVTFSFFATLVSAPFNDFLAEQAESFCVPPIAPPPSGSWVARLKLVEIDLGKTLATGLAGALAIALSWIPAVNFLAVSFLFLLMAFQYLSYPQTRRGIGLVAGFRAVLRNPFRSLGFGASVTFLFSIPFLSSLSIPLAVVGGTLLFARLRG